MKDNFLSVPQKQKKFQKFAFVANQTQEAQEAYHRLEEYHNNGNFGIEDADAIIVLGGDGLMLRTAHQLLKSKKWMKPIYGMHCGSIGFLMNELNEDNLPERLQKAELSKIHPLVMTTKDTESKKHTALAINEISMIRQTSQAGKLRITVNGQTRMEELICDGLLVATPAGSTAYNLSAQGPILPITSPLLALTPLNPFRPRRWRGALLSNQAHIRIDVIEPENRAVSASADHTQISNVISIEIEENKSCSVSILFDPGHNLDERILREQFDCSK
ncbi:MAG: NAD kinase [Alphaproteobacteria bacterium]|nr:NAD kinase [Alphaproteobacteria bacterium]